MKNRIKSHQKRKAELTRKVEKTSPQNSSKNILVNEIDFCNGFVMDKEQAGTSGNWVTIRKEEPHRKNLNNSFEERNKGNGKKMKYQQQKRKYKINLIKGEDNIDLIESVHKKKKRHSIDKKEKAKKHSTDKEELKEAESNYQNNSVEGENSVNVTEGIQKKKKKKKHITDQKEENNKKIKKHSTDREDSKENEHNCQTSSVVGKGNGNLTETASKKNRKRDSDEIQGNNEERKKHKKNRQSASESEDRSCRNHSIGRECGISIPEKVHKKKKKHSTDRIEESDMETIVTKHVKVKQKSSANILDKGFNANLDSVDKNLDEYVHKKNVDFKSKKEKKVKYFDGNTFKSDIDTKILSEVVPPSKENLNHSHESHQGKTKKIKNKTDIMQNGKETCSHQLEFQNTVLPDLPKKKKEKHVRNKKLDNVSGFVENSLQHSIDNTAFDSNEKQLTTKKRKKIRIELVDASDIDIIQDTTQVTKKKKKRKNTENKEDEQENEDMVRNLLESRDSVAKNRKNTINKSENIQETKRRNKSSNLENNCESQCVIENDFSLNHMTNGKDGKMKQDATVTSGEAAENLKNVGKKTSDQHVKIKKSPCRESLYAPSMSSEFSNEEESINNSDISKSRPKRRKVMAEESTIFDMYITQSEISDTSDSNEVNVKVKEEVVSDNGSDQNEVDNEPERKAIHQTGVKRHMNSDDERKAKVPKRRQSVLVNQIIGDEKPRKWLDKSPRLTGKSIDDLYEKATADNMSQEVRQRLKNLTVCLPWPIPPLHHIETRLSGRPTPAQKQQMKELDVKIKNGIFSSAEDEILKSNWKTFCSMHDFPDDPEPFLSFVDTDRCRTFPALERLHFVQFLAHGLNNRLLCSVYTRFKRLFALNKWKIGRFSADEDKIILEYMKTTNSQTCYVDLAKMLNRDKYSVIRRFSVLLENSEPIKWDLKKIEELTNEVVDVTGVDNFKQLKDREITGEEFKELSKRLNINIDKLRRTWVIRVYPRLFIPRSINSNIIKHQLVELLTKNKESDWKTINWNQIAQQFPGFTGLKLEKMLKHLVSYHVPVPLQSDLKETLQYINDVVLPQVKLRGRKIKRVNVREQEL